MSFIGRLHNRVFSRRVSILATRISSLLPQGAKVLDVGCGDGTIDVLIMKNRPDVSITGIDVFIRGNTQIQATSFDGLTIPYPPEAFDAVLLVDVVHHAEAPEILLQEARRVSIGSVIIKDHTKDGLLGGPTLKFMDWVGNARHGVVLPYNYWTKRQWEETFRKLGLSAQYWEDRIHLYPWPATWFFDRSLHFIASLKKISGSHD
jgi:SAM-dependent methyltransferase